MYNQASIYKGGGVYNLGDGASTRLPANTLRFLFSKSDYDPTDAGVGSSGTWQKVDTAAANVWDWTKYDTSFANAFTSAFQDEGNLVYVIAAGDTSSITSLLNMFYNCFSLVSVALFSTSSVTSMGNAFRYCRNLKSVPLFDTSSVTNFSDTFDGCYNVEGGALALYQQASTQATPPTNYSGCFKNCGRDTTTGAAELAQIPTSWGGTAPASLNMGAPQNLTEPLSPSVIDGDDSLTK